MAYNPTILQVRKGLCYVAVLVSLYQPRASAAQALTGSLIGTVRDEQGSVLAGAQVRVSSPSLIGGPRIAITNEKGQLRFPALPPGSYVLDVEMPRFAPSRVPDIRIAMGGTIDLDLVLKLEPQSVVVLVTASRTDARNPGFGTRHDPWALSNIPTRRNGLFAYVVGLSRRLGAVRQDVERLESEIKRRGR